jgi:uncharacterized protein
MQKIKDAASESLANKKVAVTRVSRHANDHASNVAYKRRCTRSTRTRTNSKAIAAITTYARSPTASTRWRSPPGPGPPKPRCTNVPSSAPNTYGCTATPVGGSVSQPAADHGRQHGIAVIDGA